MSEQSPTEHTRIALMVYAVVRLHRAHMNNQRRRAVVTDVVRGETDGKAWFQIIEPRWTSPKLWDTESNWDWVDACYSLYLDGTPPPRTRHHERVLKQLNERLRVVTSEREELLGRIRNIETQEP